MKKSDRCVLGFTSSEMLVLGTRFNVTANRQQFVSEVMADYPSFAINLDVEDLEALWNTFMLFANEQGKVTVTEVEY